jgi:hypothetical protein
MVLRVTTGVVDCESALEHRTKASTLGEATNSGGGTSTHGHDVRLEATIGDCEGADGEVRFHRLA